MPTVHARTLARAAQIVGGVDILAAELAVPPKLVACYLSGKLPVPVNVFLRATEILSEDGIAENARSLLKPAGKAS